MNWEFHHFDTLSAPALYSLMRLRVDVFVVEQNCAYPELDDDDTQHDTLHLLGEENDVVTAYARAMPRQQTNLLEAYVKIGRVVVAKQHRGTGIAQTMMRQLIARLDLSHPGQDQVLSAQVPVVAFYEYFGFVTESKAYLEDGILHIDMRRKS